MNIVIAGGGTAGWLAAYIISKTQPKQHFITVVASSKIGIIGAGENATGLFKDILNGVFFDFKVDLEDFMQKTEATYKNGILNVNWAKDGSSYFTPLGCSPSWAGVDDIVFKYALAYDKEKIHTYSTSGYLYEHGRTEEDLQSFHFNSHKAGEYLKNICVKDGVEVLDSVIKDVILDDRSFIKEIVLEEGRILSGDLFIDASGFSRLLMNKLGVGWKSYKEYLPVDRAIPFFLHDKELMKKRYTTATALSSGWMWNVPLQTRVGAGYTYDSNFLTEDQAIEEVESVLGYKIEPIKVIKFDAGRTEKTWVNNCLAIGLAQSFVEPLEATSIHTTITQLLQFVNEFLTKDIKNTITETAQEIFNKSCVDMNDSTLDFISLHYQGGRTDSSFWRYITNEKVVTPFTKSIIEQSTYTVPGGMGFPSSKGTASACLWNWTLAGLNLLTPEVAKKNLDTTGRTEVFLSIKESFFKRLG